MVLDTHLSWASGKAAPKRKRWARSPSMFPVAIPAQAAGFHWLGTPCAYLSLADCCGDEERQLLCVSPPRTTPGCLRLRLPLSPSVPGSALFLRALSLSRAAILVLGPESTASAQVASFGKRSPAKPSHHRSLIKDIFLVLHSEAEHHPQGHASCASAVTFSGQHQLHQNAQAPS